MPDRGSGLIARAIGRPVTVAVGVILVVLFGSLSIAGIPIQLTPDIARPVLNVSTAWPGASPAEIESEVLEPQEDALKTLPNLTRMTSTARLGQGNISLELKVGTPLQEALVRASNLLSQVPEYPENTKQPVISTSGTTGPPIAVAVITSQTGRSIAGYRTWVEDEIVPLFQRINGVANIRFFGGQVTDIVIEFDPAKVAARALQLADIAQIVRRELRDMSGGDLSVGKRRLLVRTLVTPEDPEAFEDIVLSTTPEGRSIRLGEVAKVRFGLRKPSGTVFASGQESLGFLFFRESGTNVLEVTQKIRSLTERLHHSRFAPKGLDFNVIFDQSGYINGALSLVRQNLMLGGVLAILVLLIFLQSVSASAVVSIAIPVCVVGTALGMALLGRTINVVSLAGMAFAVGMVVDNALVVLENIDTWRARGVPVHIAALKGTHEVWGAILASTLTTAAVFIPIIAWQDEVGELLRDIAIAISIAVMVSLVVSVLVIPSFSARLLHRGKKQEGALLKNLARRGHRFRDRIGKVIAPMVRRPMASLAVVTVALGITVGLTWLLTPPMEYLPTGNRNLIFGVLVPPPGYSVQEMNRIGDSIQGAILEHTGVEKDGVPSILRSFYVGNPQRGFMGAVAEDPDRIKELVRFVRKVAGGIPGVFGIATQASLFGRGLGGGRSIEVEISGAKLEEIVPLGGRMLGMIREVLPDAQVRPVPSLDLGAPELRLRPKRDQLSRMGVNASDLGFAVSALTDGAIIGEYARDGRSKLDVVLRPPDGESRDPAILRSVPVSTAGGAVPLGSLVEVREELGPTVIQRIERRRSIGLQVTPPDHVALEEAMGRIRNQVVAPLREQGAIPEGLLVELAGTAGDLEIAKERFGWVLLLAVVISFLLLAALFEDFISPIAVLVTVPLAAAGGVMLLRLVDATLGKQPLDMMTTLGFVILIGVVVNNAILVVDGALSRLRRGYDLPVAMAEAVKARVRPIFMSTLTSLAGLTPMVVFPGSGSELYRGVGAVVLGGLALSTALTLFVVPALFSLLVRARGGVRLAVQSSSDAPSASAGESGEAA